MHRRRYTDVPFRSLLVLAVLASPWHLLAQGTFVYTNENASPNTVSAFSVGSNGALTLLTGSPFATGGMGTGGLYAATRIAASPGGNFLYVADGGSKDVAVFAVDPTTGNLTAVAGSPFATASASAGEISLAVTPDNKFLIASNTNPGEFTVFSIAANGALTIVVGSPFSAGGTPDGIKASPDGKFLAAALEGPVGMYSIGSDGSLTAVPGSPFATGNNFASGVDINCAANTVFAAEANGTETIVDVYSIATNGALSPISGSPFVVSSGVNSNVPVLSPNDQLLFVSNQQSDTVTDFTVASGGALALISGSPFAAGTGGAPSGLATNQSGTLLFAASTVNNIAVFSVAADGTLATVAGSPFSTGLSYRPEALAVFPPKGCGPAVTTNPTSLTFGNQVLSTTSAAQSATLSNTSLIATLNITSITVTGTNAGDFVLTNPSGACPASGTVNPGTSCTVNVTFTPTANGSRSASLTIASNAVPTLAPLPLTGTGVSPLAALAPSSLAFGNRAVGTTSTAQALTLANSGTAALTISSIALSGDYTQTNNCGSSVNAGASCTISVSFKPTAVGARSGTLTVTDNSNATSGSTQQVSVSGTGISAGDATATAVSVVPSTLTNGQTAAIAATVMDTTTGHTSTVPTGSVIFTDTVGTTITPLNNGASVNLSAGTATLTGVLLRGIGTHTINAVYAGISGSFLTSMNNSTVALNKAAVTVAGPATQPIVVTNGQTGSALVTVTGPYTTIAAPTGSLPYNILNASSTSVASGTLTLTAGSTGSTAAVPIPNTLTPGSYTISVTYGGDGNYLPTSTPTTIQAQISQITPTITWSPPSAIIYGATLSGILRASALNGTTAIPGSFAFTATPTGGSASPVTSATALAASSYTLTAIFTPTDAVTYKSVSASVALTVNRATPTVTWSPPSAITYGATLSGILNASALIGTTPVVGGFTYTATPAGGSARTVTSATILAAGSYTLTATLAPTDTSDYKSASSNISLTVNKANPAVSLKSSINPVLALNAITFTATVSSTADTPSGAVNFYDGTTLLGTGTITAGAATLMTSSLPVGTHPIKADYSGDANFLAVTSAAVGQVVEDFTLSSASSPSGGASVTTVPGGTATYSLVLGPTGGTTFPSAVTLSVSGVPPGATATFTPQTLPAGSGLTNITLSIQTPNTIAHNHANPLGRRLVLAMMMGGLVLLPFGGRMRRSAGRAGRFAGLMLLLLAATCGTLGLSACGGAGGDGYFAQQVRNYAMSITAASGALSHTTHAYLTVQ